MLKERVGGGGGGGRRWRDGRVEGRVWCTAYVWLNAKQLQEGAHPPTWSHPLRPSQTLQLCGSQRNFPPRVQARPQCPLPLYPVRQEARKCAASPSPAPSPPFHAQMQRSCPLSACRETHQATRPHSTCHMLSHAVPFHSIPSVC